MSNPIPNPFLHNEQQQTEELMMVTVAIYDKKKKCPVCLREFWASKRTAIYCSTKCRVRAHRYPPLEERIKELYEDAHVSIMGIVALTGGRDFDGYRAQLRLKALFVEIVNGVDDRTRRQMYESIQDDVMRLFRNT